MGNSFVATGLAPHTAISNSRARSSADVARPFASFETANSTKSKSATAARSASPSPGDCPAAWSDAKAPSRKAQLTEIEAPARTSLHPEGGCPEQLVGQPQLVCVVLFPSDHAGKGIVRLVLASAQ